MSADSLRERVARWFHAERCHLPDPDCDGAPDEFDCEDADAVLAVVREWLGSEIDTRARQAYANAQAADEDTLARLHGAAMHTWLDAKALIEQTKEET